MKLRWFIRSAVFTGLALVAVNVLLSQGCYGPPLKYTRIVRVPAISPDYTGLVIPPNIAPLNFIIQEPGAEFRVSIHGPSGDRGSYRGKSIELATRRPEIEILPDEWRALLKENAGGRIETNIFARDGSGQWIRYQPLVNIVAKEPIDSFLVYRLLDPVFRCWGNISIQQRDLASFDESCILSNRSIQYDCINCHSFSREHPDRMTLQVRSETIGPRMLLSTEGQATAVNTATEFNRSPSSYLAWHPNGQAIAFAAIKVTQFFHAVGETRDVFDTASDLGLYLVDSNTVTTTPAIARPDRLETYPSWSPDGKYLYFCSGPQLPIEQYREVRYDLMRISYDPQSGAWGEPETLLAAADFGGSITHPRVSPDGRFLMFCRCDYGNFSIYHPESDLYLLNLQTRQHHKMEINSDRSDSYHTWSANGRWVVFSSKRRDGLLTHPYLSYIDENGQAHKPFILPQKDPAFYDSSLKVFNVPELAASPMEGHAGRLLEAFRRPSGPASAVLDRQVTTRSSAPEPEGPWRPAQ